MIRNTEQIVLLFDSYTSGSQKLHESFRMAGCEYPVLVLEEDGFLPDGVRSIYECFLGYFEGGFASHRKPMNSDDIHLEQEIQDNQMTGRIIFLEREREELLYGWPVWSRIVKAVEWLDAEGTVHMAEHYNRFGMKYARTLYDSKGIKISKTYYSAEGQEIISENCIEGSIFLQKEGEQFFFHTKADFVKFLFEHENPDHIKIFYNTLAIPFLVSLKLEKPMDRDILFWQEPLGESIPGNMQIILSGRAGRTAHVVVQEKDAYDKLMELGVDPGKVHKLGFLYPFKKKHSKEMEVFIKSLRHEYSHKPEALICTNSDQIEHCHELVRALPQMQFHIAALTTMSPKLMPVGEYENVKLWPGIRREDLEDLFAFCDYYFDINYGAEIVSAVRRAFLNDLLILAFCETAHNREYIAKEHIYPIANAEQMIAKVEELMGDRELLERHLAIQHDEAMAENDDPRCLLKYQMAQYLVD